MISVESTKMCSCIRVTPRPELSIGPRTVFTRTKQLAYRKFPAPACYTFFIQGDLVMRKTLALCILAVAPLAAESGAMNDAERAFLIEQLEKSKKDFLSSIAGVTAAQ